MPSTLHYWLASLYLPQPNSHIWIQATQKSGGIEKLFSASMNQLTEMGLTPEQSIAIKTPNWQAVERDLLWSKQIHHHLLTLEDATYPALLKETHNPPRVLFVKGNAALLNTLQVGLVGSRNPTPYGMNQAEQFAYALAQAGLTVTSGLARGIDGAGHRGALRGCGQTIAVFGTGLNVIYPASHIALAGEILERGGALLSELPLDMPPRPIHFPYRNRIISGLSIGVLVVEAALKSGSLITAKHALSQNREVFAMPGSIHNPAARGCHALIRQGAKLVESVQDILDELSQWIPACEALPSPRGRGTGWGDQNLNNISPHPNPLPLGEGSASIRAIFTQISYDVTPIDTIILQSGLTSAEVSSILLELELAGHIQSVAGGYVRVLKK